MNRSLPPWLKEQLLNLHDRNYFAKYLGMEIVDVHEGEARVSMFVTYKHTNIRGVIHGGALMSLADMAMGLACASLGRRIVTLDLNINFIGRTKEGDTVTASTKVIHHDKTTIIVEGDITDRKEKLLAKTRGTFFVIGEYRPEDG